jgi:hypothetical protein
VKTSKPVMRGRLAIAGLIIAVCTLAFTEEHASNVPNIFNSGESEFQNETHFLVFTGSDTAGEDATTAKAYYDAIDPGQAKRNFPAWLVKTGFISNVSEWNPTGPQKVACGQLPNLPPGCDVPAGTHGFGIISADSHVIVLNASDLGFVRNQFIRCLPSCTAANPIIYTYLENYPVNTFAATDHGGSGFPIFTGYPTQAEAKAAIASALQRPRDNDPSLPAPPCSTGDTAFHCKVSRIADVAFEWAPPPGNPTSTARYGQLYAYLFQDPGGSISNITELLTTPTAGEAPNLATGQLESFAAGDPFPPNLDFIGAKQHPGVCFVCHGGEPRNLNTFTGAYPSKGKVDGFRFLPVDVRNLLFTSDNDANDPTSRASQELMMKKYNVAVLKTVTTKLETDDQGTLRQAHLRDAIVGWYANAPGDKTMSSPVQHDYIPPGWREAIHGGNASAGSEALYEQVIAPNCRSCHFNRELSLDFGTVKNFNSFKPDVLELVLLPFCQGGNPQPGKRPMPLAHLTYQRFWEAQAGPQTSLAADGPLTSQNVADQIATHFGYASLAAYCATIH